MDSANSSDGAERAWDRPWTTQEMREHKNDWSLACDVGLFRHLQKFSENLTNKVETTQSALDGLVDELKETSVMIDNVTNVSLALANTQFIESRVREDEIIEKQIENLPTTKEFTEIDVISAVSESIKQSLLVMNDKYERVEVSASSESEDETDVITPSIILKARDPYEKRPLPYVIGSEKWRASTKLGLESSSSESEMGEEEEEEEVDDYSESDQETKPIESIFNTNSRPAARQRSPTSSSSASSSEYDKSNLTNGASSRADKIHTRSQDTLNSTSEIETLTAVGLSKDNYRKGAPSFAEELAKRLGNVLPVHKSTEEVIREPDQASINHSRDNLFGSDDDNGSVFSTKSDNPFSNNKDLFDDKVSNSLWKEKPAPRPQNMIPPSLDVPPPMNSIETKPKSAIDDLFGDNESDDSDDIFAPKNSKFMAKPTNVHDNSKKVSNNKIKSLPDDNVMTSTPETHNNIPNLFEDDGDDGNLFSPIENFKNRSPEAIRNLSRKPPGIVVNQSDLLSSALGSKLFNRPTNHFSDSSDNESDIETEKDIPESFSNNENQSAVNRSESVVAGSAQQADGGGGNNEITADSSGISIRPTSVNSTFGLSLPVGEPQMESTRLLSEEIYRERIRSDSLYNPRQNNTTNSSIPNNSNNILNQAQRDSYMQQTSNSRQEDIFDSDDVFSPPPLPKANPKSKSKVNSLFDDSDSGDDLFSNTSSGSRSQKSNEHTTANNSQFNVEKSKLRTSATDLFSNNSSEIIDIFGDITRAEPPPLPKSIINKSINVADKLIINKTNNLFDNDKEEDEDDEDNLFSIGDKKRDKMVDTNEDNKSLAPTSSVAEEIKKVSKNDLFKTEKTDDIINSSESQKIFEDDNDDDDKLFSSKNKNSPPVDKISAKDEETTTDGPAVSKQKISENTEESCKIKIEPPKSLKIRLPIPGGSDEAGQAPKRAVSDKIKNLSGMIGNLKILSPTDTPPHWRKSEDKQESGEATPENDIADGSAISLPKNPPVTKDAPSFKEPSHSPTVDTETAVSFDVPAQPETLSIASKSRARIPTKRRPQSRQARQSALRHSGIDFDSVDTVESTQANTGNINDNADRLPTPTEVVDGGIKPALTLLTDDKSEISLEKDSSMSITKNTMLSPSTDEEDLFDVPPDLPEDTAKEDTLFGRAPILSPVSRSIESVEAKAKVESKNDEKSQDKIEKEASDPLRNINHDPLNDPSSLFAFVTKTPSPEKVNNSVVSDDDSSLFSQSTKKKLIQSEMKKSPLDLFADDDTSGDLFSGPFTKPIVKKSTKEPTKSSLFADINSDEDDGDDLFGSASSKRSNNSKSSEIDSNSASRNSPKSGNIFGHDDDNDDDEELFFDASEKPSDIQPASISKIQKTKLEDIFGDPSSSEDDIFSTKKIKNNTNLFSENTTNVDNNSDIFSNTNSGEKAMETRATSMKKPVTRDLKKTAEKIVEDPLSMFQDE